ncbi:hypothetical protein I4U23_014485 [Adineta vaga]|nr:hypothetical protein I4U23_014485 [Adineta vaga]
MSPTMESAFQSSSVPEESYCAPWDLKAEEEKLRLLNQQHHLSSLNVISKTSHSPLHSVTTNKQSSLLSFHRTSSVRASSKIQSELPPLPSRDLIATYQSKTNLNINNFDSSLKKIANCLNSHTIRTDTTTSRSFLFKTTSPKKTMTKYDNKSIPFETALFRLKCLSSSIHNSSLPKTSPSYEQPWDDLHTSYLHNRHGRSLQKLPNTEEIPTFSTSSSYRQADDLATMPIDRYFWYHYGMSRRQAENILESRPMGSFLVRQSESGNPTDYSLSIKTMAGCMHMRICYCNGFYILGECSRPFSSVAYMIKYFTQISVPIHGAPHIKLGAPVLRYELLSSSLISNEELL